MPKPKFDFEAFLRRAFRQPLDAVAGFLMKLGIDPDSVTLFGLAGTIAAACLVASGRLLAGGAVMAVMAPLDAVDGALARKRAWLASSAPSSTRWSIVTMRCFSWRAFFTTFRVRQTRWV